MGRGGADRALAGVPVPERPLDGVSLAPLLDGKMTSRPKSICFWMYRPPRQGRRKLEPYIDPELQKGTTPLVKRLRGLLTRNFANQRYTTVTEHDYAGPRAILDNRYKLLVDAEKGRAMELFDLRNDPAEKHDLAKAKPDVAGKLQAELRQWQASALNSLLGRDYR